MNFWFCGLLRGWLAGCLRRVIQYEATGEKAADWFAVIIRRPSSWCTGRCVLEARCVVEEDQNQFKARYRERGEEGFAEVGSAVRGSVVVRRNSDAALRTDGRKEN